MYDFYLKKIAEANQRYHMLQPQDKPAVALSGGKDSMSLLFLLKQQALQLRYNLNLVAIHVDYGWQSEAELALLKNFCKSLDISCYFVKINYPPAPYKLDCAICARIRRGALLAEAAHLGCNKVALGHHSDDAAATVLLNLFNGGRFRSFAPVVDYPEQNIQVIRPLIYLNESALEHLAVKANLPTIATHCPYGDCSKRHHCREALEQLSRSCPDIRQRIIHALENLDSADRWR